MKSIISINNKFMDIIPKYLVEIISRYPSTNGVEVCINFNSEEERKYLDELVFELNRNNLILQIHADVTLELDKQIEYMKELEKYSDLLGYPIVVTIHTIYDDDKEISKNKTIDYLSELISGIDTNKIVICLENLNDSSGKDRLNKEEIKSLVLNDESIYFTYDMGHELADYGDLSHLDEYMLEDIRNIHIHTHDDQGRDHLPIYPGDEYSNNILKGLLYLEVNKYKYNIVYEYDLYECRGETTEEQLIDYLQSIDYVSEKYR